MNRIRIVKPDKARQIEDGLIRMAQYGHIRERLDENALIPLLEQFNKQTQKETKITFTRRTHDFDDSSE